LLKAKTPWLLSFYSKQLCHHQRQEEHQLLSKFSIPDSNDSQSYKVRPRDTVTQNQQDYSKQHNTIYARQHDNFYARQPAKNQDTTLVDTDQGTSKTTDSPYDTDKLSMERSTKKIKRYNNIYKQDSGIMGCAGKENHTSPRFTRHLQSSCFTLIALLGTIIFILCSQKAMAACIQ
jgi:hypothetical protein